MKPYYLRTCLIFGFLLWMLVPCTSLLQGQEVPQIIRHSRTDYNAAHQNWSITQSCDFYVFVANTKGVLMFNGFSWKLLRMPNGQKPRCLYTSDDCKVYVAGYEFFGYIDYSDNMSPYYVPVGDDLLKGQSQEIWKIFGIDGSIYFQSFANLYSYKDDQIAPISLPGNIMFGEVIADDIYIPQITKGLYQLNREEETVIEVNINLPDDSKIAGLADYGGGEMLIGTQYEGLHLWDREGSREINSDLNTALIQEQVNKILKLRNGDFAIGTILGGLYIVDSQLKVKYHLRKRNGLSNNTVLALYESTNGDLWVALDKGVNIIKLGSGNRFYYDQEGQLGTVFTSIEYNQSFYLGTNQGLFQKQKDGTYKLINNSQGQVWSMLEIDGDLLIGHNTGTYQMINGVFTKVSDETGAWVMWPVESEMVLQATYTGLVLLHKAEDKWQFKQRVEGGNIIISEARLNDHRILGHNDNFGVVVIDLNENYSTVTNNKYFREINGRILTEDIQLNVQHDPLGFILDDKHYRLSQETELIEIPSDSIDSERTSQHYELLQDWASTLSLSNAAYIRNDSLTDYLIVGIDEGYVKIQKNSSYVPDIAIDYIGINGRQIEKTNSSFGPKENDLRFQLSNMNYDQIGNDWMYKVKGWLDNWSPISKDGSIELVNMEDGDYELIIKKNDKTIPMYQWDIAPYWYKSWPGFILYGITLVGLFLVVRAYNREKLIRQRKKIVSEKQIELESALIKSKNQRLEREVIYKSKMLANSTMTLVQKNKMLGELRIILKELTDKKEFENFPKNKLYKIIDRNLNSDKDWEIFEKNFAAVHDDFLEKLKDICPEITMGELKLAAYIKMNLSSKEIAPLLNISVRSIENKRYRLRKKLNISRENNLKDYLLSL